MDLEARGQAYKLLAHAYYPPGEGLLELLGRLRPVLSGLEPLTTELEGMESYLRGLADLQELAVEHTRLFPGAVRAEAYPYESMYLDGKIMGESTQDVLRQYRQAGLQVAEGYKELPDHITAELEFMYYLRRKESIAIERDNREEADRFHLLAQSFLKEHLARWVPHFAERILESTPTPFYRGLARITRDFIAQEIQALAPPAGG